jgi:putative zinc finger/helix-turn-helix YgiT family protein
MREKRKRGEPAPAIAEHTALPTPPSFDGADHSCGGQFALTTGPRDVPIRGTIVTVQGQVYRCSSCGEERVDLDQLDATRRAASEALTASEGLLKPDEITALRNSLGLSQDAFEKALGLGPKTMVRWETGKVMPSQAMALLLLLIRRDPSAMGFLMTRDSVRAEPVEPLSINIVVLNPENWQLSQQPFLGDMTRTNGILMATAA